MQTFARLAGRAQDSLCTVMRHRLPYSGGHLVGRLVGNIRQEPAKTGYDG